MTSYGVLNAKGTGAARKTFVIDPEGKVVHVFTKVKSKEHDREVLEILDALQKS